MKKEKRKKDERKYTLAYYFNVVTQTSGVSCDDSVVLGSLQAVISKAINLCMLLPHDDTREHP